MTARLAPRQSGIALALVLLSVVLVAVVPATSAVAAVDGSDVGGADSQGVPDTAPADLGESGVPAQTATPTNNTSVQHEDPDATGGEGNRGSLQQWLEGRLAGSMEGSLVELSEGDYELAAGLLSDEWEDRLGQYVDVAGETDSEDDDQTAEDLQETADAQRNYTRLVRDYRETLELLRAAQAAGNQTAVRQYARELDRLSSSVVGYNATLVEQFEGIQNRTGVDLERARETLRNVTTNISATQAEINEETFVRTRLSVRANRSRIAFSRPVRLSGTIRTANGSVIGDGTVTIRVGRRDYTVQTSADGEFDLAYRPVAVPVGEQTLSVRYVPEATSPYLGNGSAISVTVEQVSPTIELTGVEGPYRFGDAVGGGVQVAVDGRPVPGVPTTLTVAGTVLDRASTAADGRSRLSGSLPAAIPTGTQSVSARVPWEGRAIASGAATSRVEVLETETAVTLSANFDPDAGLLVNGTLRTAAGPPVANHEIAITVADGEERTVRTGPNGGFQTTASATALRDRELNGSVAVVASFAGEGTNLAPSQRTESVELPAAWTPDRGSGSMLLPIVVVLGILFVGGLGVLWVRREETEAGERETPAEPAANEGPSVGPAPPSFLLDRARTLLESDDREGTVAEAYAAVRQDLASRHDLPANLTHREFEAACREVLAGTDADRFAIVAEAYEQLVFAGDVTAERAKGALQAAEEVLE